LGYGHDVKPRLLLTVIAVAALAIAGTAVIVLTINEPARPDFSFAQGPITTQAEEQPGCPDVITVYFQTDEAMRRAEPEVEGDTRLYNVIAETKAAAYERFKVIFKDQPEMLRLARPEDLPASLTLAVGSQVGKDEMAAELRRTYAPAEVADPCELTSRYPLPGPTATTR
jgi:FtsX extracellular domain